MDTNSDTFTSSAAQLRDALLEELCWFMRQHDLDGTSDAGEILDSTLYERGTASIRSLAAAIRDLTDVAAKQPPAAAPGGGFTGPQVWQATQELGWTTAHGDELLKALGYEAS